MVFFNYATMQMAAKIVYYGPGLCGKTTNLRYIYEKTSPQSRGEMVSLETETDRTLFFDLLPIDVGVIGGFKTRLQLYTVPGQVFYNTTRKLVLKGVDGIVFVADSQRAMVEANADSFANLRDNLVEIGLDLEEIPLVIQLNKRDLPNVADRSEIVARLDPEMKYESVDASAMTGEGVFETLKVISKLTLRTLRKRMMGEEAPRHPAPAGRRATFQVRAAPSQEHHAPTVEAAAPRPEPFPEALEIPHSAPPAVEVGEPEPIDLSAEPEPARAEPGLEQVDSDILADEPAPVIAEPVAPAELPSMEPELDTAPEPETVDEEVVVEAAPPSASEAAPPAPEVRRLKVRSSIDIMAELEQLRKRATQTPAVRRHDTHAKEAARKIAIAVSEEILSRARRVHVEVSFEDAGGTVVKKESRTVELEEETRLRSLTLDLEPESSGD